MKTTNIYKKIVAIIFFIFFTTPIFSPSINNFTIYIHWFIPLLDMNFWTYIIKLNVKRKYLILITTAIVLTVLFGHIAIALKIVTLMETLLYIFYCKKNNILKYLYWGINFNIVIAIMQFVLYYIKPEIAMLIGPTQVAKAIWGEYATKSLTNLYPIFNLVRVSGWSREAGFFASLIVVSFLTYISDDTMKKSKIQYIMFIIAFIISFSKSSFIILLIFIIFKFKKYIDKIPYIVGVITILAFGIIASNYLEKNNIYVNKNKSIIHRISGYSVITDLNIEQLLFGVDTIEDLGSKIINKHDYLMYIYEYQQFCGVPSIVIHDGVIIYAMFMAILKMLNMKTSELWGITVITLTVDYFTSTSFVVLGYYLCLAMATSNKSNEIKKYKEIEI